MRRPLRVPRWIAVGHAVSILETLTPFVLSVWMNWTGIVRTDASGVETVLASVVAVSVGAALSVVAASGTITRRPAVAATIRSVTRRHVVTSLALSLYPLVVVVAAATILGTGLTGTRGRESLHPFKVTDDCRQGAVDRTVKLLELGPPAQGASIVDDAFNLGVGDSLRFPVVWVSGHVPHK